MFFERGDEGEAKRCERERGTEQEVRPRVQLPYLLGGVLQDATNHDANTKNTLCSVMT